LDQQNGYNYIRVTHRRVIGNPATDVVTNYVGWVNDADVTALAASGPVLDNLVMAGSRYLTGVHYYTSGTADYDVTVDNAYREAYSDGSCVTFTTSVNISIPVQVLPPINPATEDHTKSAVYTNLVATITAAKLLDQSITASTDCTHPISGHQLAAGGVQSINNILMYNVASAATVIMEDFIDEVYRLEVAAYNAQASLPGGTIGNWDSTLSRAGGGALFVYNERLVGKGVLANGGNFGGIVNGPPGNVDYSGIAGLLTYYRRYHNNSGGSHSNFNLTILGSGTIVTSAAPLGANANVFVEIKLPGKTGWCKLTPYLSNPLPDGSGVLSGVFDSSLDAINQVTFGTAFVANGESMVIRITADAAWTGYLETMSVAWV
jgi:hypothetical protein